MSLKKILNKTEFKTQIEWNKIVTFELRNSYFISKISSAFFSIHKKRNKHKTTNRNELKEENKNSTRSELNFTSEECRIIKSIAKDNSDRDISVECSMNKKKESLSKNLDLRVNHNRINSRISEIDENLHDKDSLSASNSNAWELHSNDASYVNSIRIEEHPKMIVTNQRLHGKTSSQLGLKSKNQDDQSYYFDEVNSFNKANDASSTKSVSEKWSFWFDRNSDAVLMNWGHGGICYQWACTNILIDERCHFWRSKVACIFQVNIFIVCINFDKSFTLTTLNLD